LAVTLPDDRTSERASRADFDGRSCGSPGVFGKPFHNYLQFARTGMVLIVAMGLARFIAGISGVPYGRATHLTSVTILTFLLALIYGQRAAALRFGGFRHLIPIAILLSLTMYAFILLAMMVEGLSGMPGYFHAPGSGYAPHGMSLREHVLGQLSVMGTMSLAILGVSFLGYVLSRPLAYLRNAFLLLSAMALLRLAAGGIGVPYAAGSWLTSLTVLSVLLAVYYGYRGPSRGFDSYGHTLLFAAMIAFATTHLIVYGIVVTNGLGISNYYHAPGILQPQGMGVRPHIAAHLMFSPLLTLVLTAAGCAGLAYARRNVPSVKVASV
jgi:hypothetical protein